MRVNRRDLLVGEPAPLFGFNFAEILAAQAQSELPVDHDVVNFWVRGGLLAPKAATALDVCDAYETIAPGAGYITISVGVQPSKKAAAGGRAGK